MGEQVNEQVNEHVQQTQPQTEPRRRIRVQGRQNAPNELLRKRSRPRLPGSLATNGAAVRDARARKLWTQMQLGNQIGLNQTAVGLLERDYYYVNQAFAEHLAVGLTGDKREWTRFVLLEEEGEGAA